MKTHSLIQGSPEWLAYRAKHFNASDAPAMLGISPYKTRTQLLHELHTGIAPEVDAATQRRFDAGHGTESRAHPIAEDIIGEELYPVTGSEGKLSASFDGLTMDERIVWEHKLMNIALAESLANGIIPDSYHPQLEQQLMVSGAEKALFMATSQDKTAMEHVWYTSRPELRSAILQGWAQFAIDLENYVPTETVAVPVGRTPESLPALHIEVTGMVTASNLVEFKQVALGAIRSVNRDLKTDQDFADSSKARKWCADIEAKAKAAKQHALGQTATIDELFRALDEISSEARDTRIELERIEKARNATLKTEIVTGGQLDLADHVVQCNQRIGRALMPLIPADFAGAIKGMSKFDNMRNAVSTELARAKIAANEVADRITLNLRTINKQEGFGHLFYDQSQLALRDTDYVAMVIKSRIAGHLAAEAARLESERTRIAEQERIKAEAKASEQQRQFEALDKSEIKRIANLNTTMMVEAVIAKAQAAPLEIIAHEVLGPPTLKLGGIAERLGFQVTEAFLKSLGFEPAMRVKSCVLFHECDFPLICRELVNHINHVCDLQAA